MKKVLQVLRSILVLFAVGMAFVIVGEITGPKDSHNPFIPNITSPLKQDSEEFVIPDDCLLINFEDESSGKDYDTRKREFEGQLEAALQNKVQKVYLRNTLEVVPQRIYEFDHGVFWLKDMSTTGLMWKQQASDSEKTMYQGYEFTYYDLSDEEINAMKKEIDDSAQQVLSKVPDGADDWTATKVVHDELCKMITYDKTLELPHTHDLYGALVNHEAVCSAYSSAFHYLMGKLGHNNRMAFSDTHAWNRVYVLSYDDYVDTTWDDTDITDKDGNPYIKYDYFYLKKDEVEAIDDHGITSGDPTMTSVNESVPYNYHAHEGYLLDGYDEGAIRDVLARQVQTGTNLLTMRFVNEADYRTALKLTENDGSGMASLLAGIGCNGSFYTWSNDNVRVISIGLNAPA